MTKEEAIKILQDNINLGYGIIVKGYTKPIQEAFDMAIKALEQESCEDCISKEKVYEIASYIQDYLVSMYNPNDISEAEILNEINHYINALYDLPPVQPIRPKGHWIDRDEYDVDSLKCSECGHTEQYHENFCPSCGADMRGED